METDAIVFALLCSKMLSKSNSLTPVFLSGKHGE